MTLSTSHTDPGERVDLVDGNDEDIRPSEYKINDIQVNNM